MRKEMAASDSEQELDTPDVINLAVATHELKNDAKLLQAMENQQMRFIQLVKLFKTVFPVFSECYKYRKQ